ncbi:PDR/VanB family oxidoreductase [Streptomyces sp. S.PNR 29]|uniref:PDR/VanB family oxidoreductase n=1 Tax=Streptomyces sp. S.PNR 29 TaxID=2973805 RepID=UPI0025B16392|nr:PDR/VanB family oxidoreductase [Streptomyces sp. S.PNR 29]MDN0197700.1 PDR/VanB family oxidoreductase [Streptomyces sp. S.PNR 29]
MGGRGALTTLYCYAVLTLAAGLSPPLVAAALQMPDARTPVWIASSVVSGGLALLLTRHRPSRRLVLLLGWLLLALAVVQAFVIGDLPALAGLYAIAPVLASLAGQLTGRPRKALVVVHVIAAACWSGVALMMSAIGLTALTSDDIQYVAWAYTLMETFDVTLLGWLNFATTLSGLGVAITSQWGVIRYRWVAAKLAISVLILFLAFGWLHDTLETAALKAERLAGTGGSAAQLGITPALVTAGFGFAFLQLVLAILLSLYKPGGRTRRGRRLLAAQRAARSREIPVTVAEVREVARDIVALTLHPVEGERLPAWEPGAHIDVVLPSGRVRQYSLYGDPGDPDGPGGPDAYRIAVLREENGRGGSAEIHGLAVGARLAVRGPRNNFPLVDAPAQLFIAGGIGIVPFLSMVHRLDASGADWRLVYRGRSLDRMAFTDALTEQYGNRVTLLPSDTHARPDLTALLRDAPAGATVYCCGPEGLIDAVTAAMPVACPHGTLRVERFAAGGRAGGTGGASDGPFEAELARSGRVVRVPAGRSLLSALQEVDPTVDRSCEEGICGSCATRVLSGVPDHRDDVLQPDERERTDIIYPCVSRSHSDRIVLDA